MLCHTNTPPPVYRTRHKLCYPTLGLQRCTTQTAPSKLHLLFFFTLLFSFLIKPSTKAAVCKIRSSEIPLNCNRNSRWGGDLIKKGPLPKHRHTRCIPLFPVNALSTSGALESHHTRSFKLVALAEGSQAHQQSVRHVLW